MKRQFYLAGGRIRSFDRFFHDCLLVDYAFSMVGFIGIAIICYFSIFRISNELNPWTNEHASRTFH